MSEEFDDFYESTRQRLLVECYALTGDLGTAQRAVQGAFATAWQHWRNVQRSADPEAWVRTVAHARAQGVHVSRPFHKERDVDGESRATLAALAHLTGRERKALVLTTLAPTAMPDIAREIGVPVPRVERLLRSATAKFARERAVEPDQVGASLEALGEHARAAALPDGSAVRRGGGSRRRTHSLVGVVAVVGAFLASGVVVATGDTEARSLAKEPVIAVSLTPVSSEIADDGGVAETALLSSEQVSAFDPKLSWSEGETTDNLEGNGRVLPCQQQRFSDPEGLAALVRGYEGTQRRTLTTRRGKGEKQRVVERIKQVPVANAVEMLERSADEGAAHSAFRTASRWFAGCADPRTQLMSTQRLKHVGAEAALFTLRSWRTSPRSLVIGVARTGSLVVTTSIDTAGAAPDTRTAAARLTAAVNAACGTPGAGECAGPADPRAVAAYEVSKPSGMLQTYDLPPVDGAVGPWEGTRAKAAKQNYAATRCDNTQFRAPGMRRPQTRTFLFLKKNVDAFGLTQSAAAAESVGRARGFIADVRERLRVCGENHLGTAVESLRSESRKDSEVAVWQLDIELSDDQVQRYWMAIMRRGKAVSQLGFTTSGDMSMARDDFLTLVRRAEERLGRLKGA